jgi:hypothetical protein
MEATVHRREHRVSQLVSAVSTHELRQFITDEIIRAFGLAPDGLLRRVLGPLFFPVANRFASICSQFDRAVELQGFRQGARWALNFFCEGVRRRMNGLIPREGPLLILSNHPGTVDALAIASCLPRDDLKIVAADIRFLRALRAASRHLIFASRDAFERMGTLRLALRHLQSDGALLIFPTGHLDPDPEALRDSEEGFKGWSPSLRFLLRRVPETQLLLTAVSGVLSRPIVESPLVWLRRTRLDRQRVAEFLQVMRQLLAPRSLSVLPNISFDRAIGVVELVERKSDIVGALEARADRLLRNHLRWLTRLGVSRTSLGDLG